MILLCDGKNSKYIYLIFPKLYVSDEGKCESFCDEIRKLAISRYQKRFNNHWRNLLRSSRIDFLLVQ